MPKVETPSKYDRKKIVTGVPSRKQMLNPVPRSKKDAARGGNFSVNGVGAGMPHKATAANSTPGGSCIRGNRVRGGQRCVSAVAITRHQQAEAKSTTRSSSYLRSTSNRSSYNRAQQSHHNEKSAARDLGELMMVNGLPPTKNLQAVVESSNYNNRPSQKVGIVRVKPIPADRSQSRAEERVNDFLSESKRIADTCDDGDDDDDDEPFDAKDVSLPSTLGNEEDEEDDEHSSEGDDDAASKEQGSTDDDDERGSDQGVGWEVLDNDDDAAAAAAAREDESNTPSLVQKEFDHDLFSSEDYNAHPPPDTWPQIVDNNNNPLYEVMEPLMDDDEGCDDDDDDDDDGSDEEKEEEEEDCEDGKGIDMDATIGSEGKSRPTRHFCFCL